MTKYISNHPFIFLSILVVVASCCAGGFLIMAQGGETPVEATVTATARLSATETESVLLPSEPGVTPSVAVFAPTETSTPENTVTSAPAAVTVTPTVEETASQSVNPLVVHFIDVGQGDAILVVGPDGQTALIDGGSGGSGVAAYLRAQGVERIDLMVATHPHEDHIGGLIEVLELMPVGKVVTNGQSHTTATFEHFLDAILNTEAEYSEVQRGDTLTLGDVEFSVLNPGRQMEDDLNDNSIVLRFSYGQTTFLLMGDAGIESQDNILAAGLPVRAEIMKVAHHGSCSALNRDFLDAVQAEVGIYTAGRNNQYELPCEAEIYALEQRDMLVLGTDVNGSIIVTVTEDGYRITNSPGEELGR